MNKILFFTSFVWSAGVFAGKAPHESEIIQYALDHLQLSGTLKNTGGFIYIDLDDHFIHGLLPYIQDAGFEQPPYFDQEGLVGAHISVIFPDELHDAVITECGKTYSFQLMGCLTVAPERFKGLAEFCFLIIDAPELNALREKYGLSKNPFDFHITIGVKKKCPLTLDASGHFVHN